MDLLARLLVVPADPVARLLAVRVDLVAHPLAVRVDLPARLLAVQVDLRVAPVRWQGLVVPEAWPVQRVPLPPP